MLYTILTSKMLDKERENDFKERLMYRAMNALQGKGKACIIVEPQKIIFIFSMYNNLILILWYAISLPKTTYLEELLLGQRIWPGQFFTINWELHPHVCISDNSMQWFIIGHIARLVRGLKRRDSGCLKGEAAFTAPRCSQLRAGQSTPVALCPSSQ